MHNQYHPEPAKITQVSWMTKNIKLFRFEPAQKVLGHKFSFQPGQFVELTIPGFGEAPFAPCNAPGTDYFELCVRNTGRLTNQLHSMKAGDEVLFRGPLGHGWPVLEKSEKKNLLIVVGGLGLIPLRTLILGREKYLGPDSKIQVFYGARSPEDMLFRHEFEQWKKNGVAVNLSIDKQCPGWSGCVGLVTELFEKNPMIENARAFLCGPPVMYKSVIAKSREKGFADDDIFVSLERRMHCGVGVCQHCAVGPYYTCKDGPVFSFQTIKDIPEAI